MLFLKTTFFYSSSFTQRVSKSYSKIKIKTIPKTIVIVLDNIISSGKK